MVHVIKVYLECQENNKSQIRRLAVSSDVVNNFDLLHEKITDLFPTIEKDFEVGWKDPEGDLVQMSSDAELAQALANAEDGLIKLYVSVTKPLEKQEEPKASYSHINETHPRTVCDACNVNICGIRYKCLQCRDYDLCSACNAAYKHAEHDMIRLVRPNYVPREWVFSGARAMWRSMFGHYMKGFHQCYQSKEESNESSSSKQQKAPNSPSENWKEMFIPYEKPIRENLQSFLRLAAEGLDKHWPLHGEFTVNMEAKTENPKNKAHQKSEDFETTMPEKAKESPNGNRNDDSDGIRVTAEPEKAECNGNFETGFDSKTSTGTLPKENNKHSASEVECGSTENQEKKKTPESDANILESSNSADGWTLLNKEETGKKEIPTPEPLFQNDSVQKESNSESAKATIIEEKESIPKDPRVANALKKMCAMGFTNEGGWLERLLITKDGNINDALDALYPNTLRH